MGKTLQQWVEEVMSWWVKDAGVSREQAAKVIVREFAGQLERTERLLREDNARLRQELASARAENRRLRNGLRYLFVKLGVSSNLTIGKLALLAWDIAEKGEEAPEHIIDKQQMQQEQEEWEAAQDETH